MSMTNAERQAAYRAKRKAELDALRNSTPSVAPSRNDDDHKQLRNEVKRLQEENEALRNSKPAPSRNGKCRNCEKLEKHLTGAKMREDLLQDKLKRKLESKEIPYNVLHDAVGKATIKLRNELDKEKAKRRRVVERLKEFRASRIELLPDEVRQEQSKIKAARTRLQNDRSSFDARVSMSKRLDKSEIRLVQRCLHSDKQPEERRKQYDAALASFNRAVT